MKKISKSLKEMSKNPMPMKSVNILRKDIVYVDTKNSHFCGSICYANNIGGFWCTKFNVELVRLPHSNKCIRVRSCEDGESNYQSLERIKEVVEEC